MEFHLSGRGANSWKGDGKRHLDRRRRRLKCEGREENAGKHRRPFWATLGRSGGHRKEVHSPAQPTVAIAHSVRALGFASGAVSDPHPQSNKAGFSGPLVIAIARHTALPPSTETTSRCPPRPTQPQKHRVDTGRGDSSDIWQLLSSKTSL